MAHPHREEFNVTAGNGGLLRAWQNGAGPSKSVVLLCPGLETDLDALSAEFGANSGVRLLGWRSGHSPSWEDHLADAVAVLDAADTSSCVVVGWSATTTVAAELARRFPDRVRGLMLIGAPARMTIPEPVDRMLRLGGSWSVELLRPLLRRAPAAGRSARLLREAVAAVIDQGGLPAAVGRFANHDWSQDLLLNLILPGTVRAEGIHCPVTVLAGRYDPLPDVAGIAAVAASLPQARLRILATSHFLPLEAPAEVAEELALLLHRVATVEYARLGIVPPAPTTPRCKPKPATADSRERTHPPLRIVGSAALLRARPPRTKAPHR